MKLSHPTQPGGLPNRNPSPTVPFVLFVMGPYSTCHLTHPLPSDLLFLKLLPREVSLFEDYVFWWCFQLLLSQLSVLEVLIEANQAGGTWKEMWPHVRYLTLKILSLSTASVFSLDSKFSVWSSERSRSFGAGYQCGAQGSGLPPTSQNLFLH